MNNEKLSLGQKVADLVTSKIGSWAFVLIQNAIIIIWCIINSNLILKNSAFDPYPWILLNLVLSLQAAQTGPVVIISTKRQEESLQKIIQYIAELSETNSKTIQILLDHAILSKQQEEEIMKLEKTIIKKINKLDGE